MRRFGLGSFFDDVGETIEQQKEVGCLLTANQSPAVAAIDAKTMDLAKNWQPTGYFTVDEIDAITSQIHQADATALAQVLTSPKTTSDADTSIKQAVDYISRNETRMQTYVDAAKQARAQGLRAVYAPGLKTWVTNSMVNIAQAYTTLAALSCRATWFDTAASVVDDIWGAAKAIGALVLNTGEAAVSAVEGLAKILPYVKWIALAVALIAGGTYAYRVYHTFERFEPHPSLPQGA